MQAIGLTEREIKLALVDPKHSSLTVTSRLDAFIDGHMVKFVEYNAENPSSLTDQAGLNEILLEVGAMREMTSRYQLTQFRPDEYLLSALLNTFREWGGSGVPNIAILDWRDLPTADEFVLLKEFFVSRGVPTVVCEPEQLEYKEGRLRCGGFPIDIVYKRVIINELLARCDDSHPLIRAYIAGDVCLVNSFRCKLVHKKASFELLTDEANEGWFTAREREVIRQTVPGRGASSSERRNTKGGAVIWLTISGSIDRNSSLSPTTTTVVVAFCLVIAHPRRSGMWLYRRHSRATMWSRKRSNSEQKFFLSLGRALGPCSRCTSTQTHFSFMAVSRA